MTPLVVDDLIRFVGAVVAFAVVGIGIGMLVARRLDRWAAAFANDDPLDPTEEPEEHEEPGDDARPDA